MRIAITRLDRSAQALRQDACRAKDADQARLLAIALVLEGQSRTDAATAAGRQRQTLRDWVHRTNAEGVAGLVDRPRPGRPARMSAEHLAALDALVADQPEVATHGVVRRRRADLKTAIATRFGVELSERSVGRLLNARGFRRLSVRPRLPQSDVAAQEAFKKTPPTP